MPHPVTTVSSRVRLVEQHKTRLEVTRGPDVGLSLEIVGNSARIGTAPENDLVLSDQTVSRQHCEIVPTPNGVRLRDEGSTNGVVVGALWVRDATFAGQTQIEL
ncbi:MAG TPA: FHA domain-containing protein, partial [Polyangiaceae bacterium]|nr:FHA domain-containing protein [Polyangiaceae bacterium]